MIAFILHYLSSRDHQPIGYEAFAYTILACMAWFFQSGPMISGIRPMSIVKDFAYDPKFFNQAVGGRMAFGHRSEHHARHMLSWNGPVAIFIMLFLILMIISHRRVDANPL
ncbi:hypothetical protein F5Y13DRAFT_11292 [Hypoxylon sp. FL1857]|nr:hypothetical protein F5Y13DRAFT_11292 [Hypoxylon sp. FL1857]